ncbi:hypothetical protein M3A96_04470 [Helcobacillus massiliensis]|uniref:hypothetical protein n=1 Tax=Helcobacillus massiliensis TaxID=521392 RepID=UPI0021A290F8|nr:hypothetical protein [Helcobacillus massiliensis]MCT1557374.1 hypothetical protein [Helcobacillus massiliensis]MCT2036903.1 hypothetical protein [Helcobacillus massiliensis]MCT2331659.1 hypothetical protein [Helcobacillus massiliensis]
MSNHRQSHKVIELSTLADAQDGSEVLFAVARILEEKHGPDYGYAILMRQNAHAIRDIIEQMQPWIVANEPDPLLQELWQDIAPRDSITGAGNHRRELATRLGLPE